MKNKLLIVLFFFVTGFANAQQYPPLLKSMEWYVGSECPWVGYSSGWYSLINDSIINGITYKQYRHSNITQSFCVREDTGQKKIWINDNSQEELLYDFNMTVGDTFTYQSVNFILVMEDSVNTCMGQRRKIKFDPIPGQWSQPTSFECIEGIGSLFNPFGLFFRGFPYDQCGSFLICCHQNDTITYVYSDTIISCPEFCLPFQTSINSNYNLFSEVHPNPAIGEIQITAETGEEIVILDITGREIKRIKISQSKIILSTNDFDGGIYYFCLYNKGHMVVTKKLVLLK